MICDTFLHSSSLLILAHKYILLLDNKTLTGIVQMDKQ